MATIVSVARPSGRRVAESPPAAPVPPVAAVPGLAVLLPWLLLVCVSALAAYLAAVPRRLTVPEAAPDAPVAAGAPSARSWRPGEPVLLADPVISRPAGADIPVALIVHVALVGRAADPAFREWVFAHEQVVRDAIATEISETRVEEMDHTGYKATLSTQLRIRLARITGGERIQEVLIPVILLQ